MCPIFDMYYESSDISFVLRGLGFRCVVNSDSVVYHYGRSFRGYEYTNYFYVFRNKPIFWRFHDEEKYMSTRSDYLEKIVEFEETISAKKFLTESDEEALTLSLSMKEGLRISDALHYRPSAELKLYNPRSTVLVHSRYLGVDRANSRE
ncbi:glycosyltransferase family 2 protein [Roseiconus lacunae]|uniref:glycosyltransferase family 2 protein n=1 Tax=Roseiconus lacunae TaxID=2605694 RepID=UPI0036F28519